MTTAMKWHILDVGSVWLKEFAAALSKRVPVICWQPDMRTFGAFETWERETLHDDPELTIRHFPLQRGYTRFPVSALQPFAPRVLRHLWDASADPSKDVLICTTPFYAPVAERWPGTVVYYQTDLTIAYAGIDSAVVKRMDQRMCKVAKVVCPNSQRIANYLIDEAQCQERKITVVPNATREANVYGQMPSGPGPLPDDVCDLPRPIAGVIGNLAANMDWEFLRKTVLRTPAFSWLFVGPTEMPVADAAQSEARRELIAMGGRVRFIGSRPYGALQSYARAFDVAILPYLLNEPTYSGSSTRFYEHLAACRPMIATRGFAELLTKEPLLELAANAEQAAVSLNRLRASGFRDGFEQQRWEASFQGTWEQRAATVVDAVTTYLTVTREELTPAYVI